MLLLFYGIPFIESRFYWLPFVKNICTKSTSNNYLLKINNKSTRTGCDLCSKLTAKASGRCHYSRLDVFIFNLNIFHALHLCFYSWFWTNTGLVRGARIFRDTTYWNNCYLQTWMIYSIKSLSYNVLPSSTNRINSQLFFIVNAGFKETKIR